MVAGVETFLSMALSTRLISTGRPSMRGSGWWVHLLKAEDEYRLISHDFIFAMLDVERAMGRCAGAPGGPVRGMHLHGGGDAAAAAQ